MGDPQIGYADAFLDYLALTHVVEAVNRTNSKVLIIAGDLTQDRTLLQHLLFQKGTSALQPEAIVIPGNHDVVDEDSLELYRDRYGPDHFSVDIGSASIIAINSETAISPGISHAEYQLQWDFLAEVAEENQVKQRQSILVVHRPPFEYEESEPDSGGNWPTNARKKLLLLCRKFGIRLILAGHLHRTKQVATSDGIQVRTLAGSSKSFDSSDIGFELLTLDREATSPNVSFMRVAAPRPAPRGILGLREWTPRLFDFSFGHWFFTLMYLWAALACSRAARKLKPPKSRRPLQLVSIVLLFFAFNSQLDFDELLREIGRGCAAVTGLSPLRHVITGTALVLLVLFVARRFVLARSTMPSGRTRAAMVGIMAPSLHFILSTISHHDIGMLVSETWWDLAITASLGAVLVGARLEKARPQRLA